MDFQEFKEDVKEFFTKYKKKIIPIAGGVVAIIVLAVVLTSVFSHREEKRIPFDDIHGLRPPAVVLFIRGLQCV